MNLPQLAFQVAITMINVHKYICSVKMSRFRGKSMFPYLLINYINIIQGVDTNKEALGFSQPSLCKNNEYFDTVSLTCVECDANKNLRPSVDRSRCICNSFSKRIGFKDGYPVCTICGTNSVATTDGNDCVACNSASCKCAPNEIQIDRSLNGTLLDVMYCLHCPPDTYPFLDGSKCVPCETLRYNYYRNDIYLTKYHYTWVESYCLRKYIFFSKESLKDAFQIKFETQAVDSYYFRNELQTATDFCEKKDSLACEHLSNMCVLSLYVNEIACRLFMHSEKPSMQLFYSKSENTALLSSTQITQEYSLIKSSSANMLNFTAATFSLHGNLKSLDTPNIPCNLLEHVKFGINLKKKCKLSIKYLMWAKIEFMSPYLKFVRNDNILLHAMPILIKNINQNSTKISDWQLVRKFFLVDNISGFKTLSNVTAEKAEKASNLSVLRYMRSLSIIIDVQTTKERNKIFPPLVIIEYAELTHEQMNEIIEVTLDFEVKFTMKHSNIDSNLKMIIGILSGLALIPAGIETWSYSKRHHTSIFNVFVMIWFFIYAMGTIGSVIILYLVCLSLYLFIFYKGQTLPYVLLPEDISEKTIKTFTTVAFFFKFIEILGFICRYWNIDIFLIDWEQSKTLCNRFKCDPPNVSVNKLHTNKHSRNTHKHSEASLQAITAKRRKNSYKLNETNNSESSNGSVVDGKRKANPSTLCSISNSISINEYNDGSESPISIWRTYFIANEWINIQTKRKINIVVQLLAVSFIYQMVQVYPWFLTIPELTSKFPEENDDFILYYTVCILIYILIYCIQWLTSILFYERCIKNRMQIFVDLCSTANISILVLPFNYYGFYIHGRSVHGFADIDLPTLINDLQMEKNNLCAHRGLVPGTTQQTFILSLTETFRIAFNQDTKLPTSKGSNFRKMYYRSTMNWDQMFNVQKKLRHFLCNFIDHCASNEDYIIKEQHFLEKLLNVVFSNNAEKSTFYIDNNYSFNRALLYGNEWLLGTFEISVFIFIIVMCENCTLASVITALATMVLTTVVKHRSKQNLRNNTLVDKTFLTV